MGMQIISLVFLAQFQLYKYKKYLWKKLVKLRRGNIIWKKTKNVAEGLLGYSHELLKRTF